VDAAQDIVTSLRTANVSASPSREQVRSASFELKVLMESIRGRLKATLGDRQRSRLAKYPESEIVSLPAFGNRIAAIDSYAGARYGMDANVLWPRLPNPKPPSDDPSAQGNLPFVIL
jgi:hypothetical protein